jgi:hypothetical protein
MVGEMVENEVGRPTIMTPETIDKLEHAFALGCTDLEACFYADIGKTTLYNYQKENPKFVERKERLKENPTLIARTTVVREIAEKGDLALKYLERKCQDEFSTKQDLNVGGQKDNPIITTQLTPEQLSQAITQIKDEY